MKRFTSSLESGLIAIQFLGPTGRGRVSLCPLRTMLGLRFALPTFLLCAAGLLQPCAATPFQWEYTDSLKTARFHHTATLLTDGRVLVAGGAAGVGGERPLKSAELYDPATGSWSEAASLNTARDSNTATLLPDGMVLVAAGRQSGIYLTSAELYDPATDIWLLTGSLDTGRVFHTATLLTNGMVLVVGGIQGDIYLASAELYDPATGSWSDTGSLSAAREFHTATLLTNGKVLVAGGRGSNIVELASAELYDPNTGTWSATGNLKTARYDHTATLLSDGMVLVAGGEPEELSSAELYDPATGSWSLTGSLNQARKDHAATLLLNGMVLVTGGAFAGGVPLASAELYDPGIVAASKVDGEGAIDGQGDQADFTVRATQSGDLPSGSLSFSDPAAGVSIAKARIRTLTFNGNSADLGGTRRNASHLQH